VCEFLFYANDLKLFASVAFLEDCVRIQSDLNRLTEWCEFKSLPLNIKKCKIISFSKSTDTLEFAYILNGSVLAKVEFVRGSWSHYWQ
jgi:hypothetical protein